jgi:arsenical pump membrane protein
MAGYRGRRHQLLIYGAPLGLQQIVIILIFACAIWAILKEPRVRLGRHVLTLDYGVAPLLAVGALALGGFVTREALRDAILGINGLVPWEVMVIFFGGAYICIAIDQTGVLEYAASRIIRLSGGDGVKLYYGLVGLTAFLTIFTSNDIVTLTLTPLICYMALYAKIDPIPYLIAVFYSSNTWSMLFYIGNPPNIIVAQVFRLGFLEYARLMVLPTIVAGVSTALLTHLVFRREIGQRIALSAELGPKTLECKDAAIANLAAFGLFFVVLATSEYIGLTVWQTVLMFTVLFLALNALLRLRRGKAQSGESGIRPRCETGGWLDPLARVPWKMLPLIASFFIIIRLFTVYGITDLLAQALSQARGLWEGTVLTGIISAISANLTINQPTTILFADTLQNAHYTIGGVERLSNGLALVVGTNLGGNLTLFGALAGLMWSKILAQHGVAMSYGRFLRYSARIMPLAILLTLLTVAWQMRFLFG